jgi:hypothetical protein
MCSLGWSWLHGLQVLAFVSHDKEIEMTFAFRCPAITPTCPELQSDQYLWFLALSYIRHQVVEMGTYKAERRHRQRGLGVCTIRVLVSSALNNHTSWRTNCIINPILRLVVHAALTSGLITIG